MHAAGLIISLFLIGGVQPYSERGFADFDDFFALLSPHGVWRPYEKNEYVLITHPPITPYRNGQWLYTDFGWTWKGTHPSSWATEHYGNLFFHPESKMWLWRPGDKWYPAIVQWRSCEDYIGWRACKFDIFNNPSEEDKNNLDPSQWNFVLKEKLKEPLKQEDFASPQEVKKLLEKSVPSQHTFKAWREITREGPDPLTIWKDQPLPKRNIRSLPSPTTRPTEAGPDDAFFYRPKFHQDLDGIFHRIEILLKRAKDGKDSQENADDPRKKIMEALTSSSSEPEEEEEKAPEKSILFQESPQPKK